MLTNTIITNIHSQKEMDKVEEVLVKLGEYSRWDNKL